MLRNILELRSYAPISHAINLDDVVHLLRVSVAPYSFCKDSNHISS